MVLLCLAVIVAPKAGAAPGESIAATVTEVYDGDTILVVLGSGKKEKVRFIGIDCPEAWENEKFARDMVREKRLSAAEMLELGRMAKEFTEAACQPGSTVLLEMDLQERDRYGRLLAYVWVRQGSGAGGQGPENEAMLNAELLRAGLAKTMTILPNVRYVELFNSLQKEAQDRNLGIWVM